MGKKKKFIRPKPIWWVVNYFIKFMLRLRLTISSGFNITSNKRKYKYITSIIIEKLASQNDIF